MKAEAPAAAGKAPIDEGLYTLGPRLLKFRVPLIAASWAISYGAAFTSSRTSTAWLSLSEWCVSHGFGALARSSQYVTITVTCLAVLGAVLRVVTSRERSAARNLGFWAVCAPWGVLLPAASAGFYELAVAAASLAGLSAGTLSLPGLAGPPAWGRVLRESFPVLSAACFLTMSWQYNAQRLLQCLLIAAGISLLVRAALPPQARIPPGLPEDPAGAA